MLTEWQNEFLHEFMTDRLKTVYPPKTTFCGGIIIVQQLDEFQT